jgi:hypothetical protein
MEAPEIVRVFEIGVNTEEDRFGHMLIDGDDEFSWPFLDPHGLAKSGRRPLGTAPGLRGPADPSAA